MLSQALAAGHAVTVLTRDPMRVSISHERLRVIPGNVFDVPSVERAIQGQEAVISAFAIAYRPLRPITMYSLGTRHIVGAMQRIGVARYVGVTSAGTYPGAVAHGGVVWRSVVKPIVGATLHADMRRMEALVMQSNLQWTIARPAVLVDLPPSGDYRVQPGYAIPDTYATARADLADFLVRAATDRDLQARRAVAIATPGALPSWEVRKSRPPGVRALSRVLSRWRSGAE